MRNLPAAPEVRSPQSLTRELRRKSAKASVLVALGLVLSTFTILYTIAVWPHDIA
jgi:hypothetical protein